MTQPNPRSPSGKRDPRWAALEHRDPRADGTFVYSVKTTGVYCRPSCAARRARPENVAFHATPAAAERAGFRACKRCLPNGPAASERTAALVAKLCRFIERRASTPTLDELARFSGLSRFHTQRTFKAVTGVTPRAYGSALRARRIRDGLRTDASVTQAIYGAGYGSAARFYEKSKIVLGMTPTELRRGALSIAIRFAVGKCSLGRVLVASSERGVCAILLGDDAKALVEDLKRRFPRAELRQAEADYTELVAKVIELIERPKGKVELPLDIRGTLFQERVWSALAKVPAGQTVTYAELSARIGQSKSARAVARACGANPLAVAVPCHRVVRSDGNISGYRWGVERKRALLQREAAERSR